MDYGTRIAIQRAKAKAAKKAENEKPSPRTRGQKHATVLEEWPLDEYASEHSQDHIDWSNSDSLVHAEALAKGLAKNRMQLLSLPTGAGKTAIAVSMLGLMQENSDEQLQFIVLCPSAVKNKHGWHETISSWNRAHPGNVLRPYMIESFDRFSNILAHPSTLKTVIAGMSKNGILVIDEVHGYKNPVSKRSKQLQKLPMVKRLGMSATPIVNDIPMDGGSYLIMAGSFKNKTDYMKRTGLSERVGGLYNTLQIYDSQNRISEVLWPYYSTFKKQLADIIYRPDIDLSTLDMPEVIADLHQLPASDQLDGDLRSLARAYKKRMFDSATEFTLAVLERINSDPARLEWLIKTVSDENSVQPLVFYWHVKTGDLIETTLRDAGFHPQRISGSHRIESVDFSSKEPILVQYQSGSEGIEMKTSNMTIFYENQSSFAKLSQARGRNVRRGMDHRVVQHFVVADTPTDRRIFDTVQLREEMSDQLLFEVMCESLGIKPNEEDL